MKRAKINMAVRDEAARLIRDPRMRSKRKKKNAFAELEDILFGRCRATLLRRFPSVPADTVGRILMQTIYQSYLR